MRRDRIARARSGPLRRGPATWREQTFTASAPWSPEGFDDYRSRFPATPSLPVLADDTPTFIAAWHELADPFVRRAALYSDPHRTRTTVVFIRGYLGHYMRGNLVPARDAIAKSGYATFIAKNAAGGNVADNVTRLAAELDVRVPRYHRLIFCGHSKGGLEALTLVDQRPDLAARTRAVILSQTPRGPSHVLESVLTGRHRDSLSLRRSLAELTQRIGLKAIVATPGGLELTRDRLPRVVGPLLARAPRPFPVIQTASWSSRPTTWLDSFHERLGEIRPGVAHDGQFYLEDLLWPDLPHILLPHLDHAQPVMDGFGFDSARYWSTLLVLLSTLTPR